MTHTKLYRRSFNLYRIEGIFRNVALGLALFNTVGHHLYYILGFFVLSVVAQFRPLTFLYVKIHATKKFYVYLAKKYVRFQNHHKGFVDKTESPEQTEINIKIDSRTLTEQKQIKFMELFQK